MKPFLKYPGGKSRMLPQILPLFPRNVDAYVEPFLGGGAVFLSALSQGLARHWHVGDINPDLIGTYRAVRNNLVDVITFLESYVNIKEEFLDIRCAFNEGKPDVEGHPPERAAQYIYLNRTCFNGLMRFNRKGKFNAPYGYYEDLDLVRASMLMRTSALLQRAPRIVHGSYADITCGFPGTFFYIDPPYMPLSATASFTGYQEGKFGLKEHEDLRNWAEQMVRNKADVLVSNSDTPEVRALYSSPTWILQEVQASRSIAAKGSSRKPVGELLIRSTYEVRGAS